MIFESLVVQRSRSYVLLKWAVFQRSLSISGSKPVRCWKGEGTISLRGMVDIMVNCVSLSRDTVSSAQPHRCIQASICCECFGLTNSSVVVLRLCAMSVPTHTQYPGEMVLEEGHSSFTRMFSPEEVSLPRITPGPMNVQYYVSAEDHGKRCFLWRLFDR